MSAPSPAVAHVDPPHVAAPSIDLLYEQKVTGEVRGIALDGSRLLVNVGGALHVYDKTGEQGPTPARARAEQLVPVGDDLFDVGSHDLRSPPLPKTLQCEARSKTFSLDASRMTADCVGPKGEEAVFLFDARTGAELGVFEEFRTAAPIRAGTITESGNFVFWVARASGAFEEIKSHVTGPVMSSHSVMAPDEHATFTTKDKNWFAEDQSRAQVIDPHDGRVLFTLPTDTDTVVWSPSSQLFAAHHSKNWGDMMHSSQPDTTTFTIHRGRAEVLVSVPGSDALDAAFSRDDRHLAVRYASGVIRVYALQ